MEERFGSFNRQPINVNELQENKFTFRIHQLPEVSFKCRSANIPGTSLPVAWQNTTQNPIPHNGLNINYESFDLEFIVDEDLRNYCEIINWMRMLAAPVNNLGYSELKLRGAGLDPNRGLVADGILTILTNELVPNIIVFFRDMFPRSLSSIMFTNSTEYPSVITATVSFVYSYFDLRTVDEDDISPSLV